MPRKKTNNKDDVLYESNLDQALLKRAIGYTVEETTIEYIIDEDGNKKATKEKCSTKYYPPDVTALKAYFALKDGSNEKFLNMSDEELERERIRLIKEIADM